MTSDIHDIVLALIGAVQAMLLGWLAYKSNQRGKQTAAVQATLDDGMGTDVHITRVLVESLSDEVFKSRVAHGVLESKVDEVHAQVHALRGEVAVLSERVDVQGDIKAQ